MDSMIVDTGNSQIYPEELIDPSAGPLHLKLGLSFTNNPAPVYSPGDADKIVVTAVGLHLFSIDDGISDQISELQDDVEALNVAVDGLESDVARLIPFVLTIRDDLNTLEEEFVTHGHMYLTGKGKGHNNTAAYSGLASYEEPSTLPPPKEKKKKKSKKKKRK